MKGYLCKFTNLEKKWHKSLSEVSLYVGFNKSPKIVLHACQGHKFIGNLEVRSAMCFLKMNQFVISIFFILFSFDTALQKSGGLVPPSPSFDATK